MGALAVRCERCPATFPVRDGRIHFISPATSHDALDSVKGRLKRRLGRLYYTVGVRVFAPVYPFGFARVVKRRVDPGERLVVDLGCGNNRLDGGVIGVDIADYDEVDIVCDAGALPFAPESIDAFVSRSMLEHHPDPSRVVRAVSRATRPGGLGLHVAPFLFPVHASPDDFQRWTAHGLARLFPDWEVLEQRSTSGPVSLLLLLLTEFLATLFSFGVEGLKSWIYLLLCGLVFPLKYLDVFFVGRRSFLTLAPSIYTAFRKPEAPSSTTAATAIMRP